LALELLKHDLGGSDEDICHRLRTDFAVLYACGLREYQAPRSHVPCVLPETLCEFRGRIDEALMDELIALQAAAAVALRLTVVTSTTAQSDISGHVRDARAASVVPNERAVHETTAVHAPSSNGR
jgi:hypothetical protein